MHNHDNEFDEEIIINDGERPNIGRVIGFAVIGYAIVACAAYFFLFQLSPDSIFEADTQADTAAGIVSEYPPSAYLTVADDSLLTTQEMAVANLRPVYTAVELATLLGNNPSISTIYIHPDIFDVLEANVIQQQYANGHLIVALNTPLSLLAETLALTPTQPDLSPDEFSRGTAVAAVKQRETGAPLEFVATYALFEQIPAVLSGLR
jgi:hypothetical protein